MLLLLAAGGLVIHKLLFLQTAERTNGVVENITSSNGRCGKKRRSSSYNCTHFTAQVRFSTRSGEVHQLSIGAGSRRGHDQPMSNASYQVGKAVAVIYDPHHPETAYHDSFFALWGIPIFVLVFQVATLAASFGEPRRRLYSSKTNYNR